MPLVPPFALPKGLDEALLCPRLSSEVSFTSLLVWVKLYRKIVRHFLEEAKGAFFWENTTNLCHLHSNSRGEQIVLSFVLKQRLTPLCFSLSSCSPQFCRQSYYFENRGRLVQQVSSEFLSFILNFLRYVGGYGFLWCDPID